MLKQLPIQGEAQALEAELEPLIAMGEQVLADGDSERAVGIFTQLRDMAPEDPAVASGLARALVGTGQVDEAAALIETDVVFAGATVDWTEPHPPVGDQVWVVVTGGAVVVVVVGAAVVVVGPAVVVVPGFVVVVGPAVVVGAAVVVVAAAWMVVEVRAARGVLASHSTLNEPAAVSV